MNQATRKIEVIIKSLTEGLMDADPGDISNKLIEIRDTLPYLGREARQMLFFQTELLLRTFLLANIHETYNEEPDNLAEPLKSWVTNYNEYLEHAGRYGYSPESEDYQDFKKRHAYFDILYELIPAWSSEEQRQHLDRVLTREDPMKYRLMLTAVENIIIQLYAQEHCLESATKRLFQLFMLMQRQYGNTCLFFFDFLAFEGNEYRLTDIYKLTASDEPNELNAAAGLMEHIHTHLSADVYDDMCEHISGSHAQMTIAALQDYCFNGGIELPPSTKSKIRFLANWDFFSSSPEQKSLKYLYDETKIMSLLQSTNKEDIEQAIERIMRLGVEVTPYFYDFLRTVTGQVLAELCSEIYKEYELPEALEQNVAFDMAFR